MGASSYSKRADDYSCSNCDHIDCCEGTAGGWKQWDGGFGSLNSTAWEGRWRIASRLWQQRRGAGRVGWLGVRVWCGVRMWLGVRVWLCAQLGVWVWLGVWLRDCMFGHHLLFVVFSVRRCRLLDMQRLQRRPELVRSWAVFVHVGKQRQHMQRRR